MTIDQDHLAPRNPIIYIGTTEQTELEVRCIVILHIGIDRQRSGQENETGSVQLVITRQSVLSFKTLITTASDDLVCFFFLLFFFLFLKANKAWRFMSIICVDELHKMSSLRHGWRSAASIFIYWWAWRSTLN